jgi:hypothetical protein
MAIAEPYVGQESISSSASEWVTITPHDTAQLARIPKAIMVGATAGNIKMIDKAGNTATVPFTAGEIKPLRPHVIHTDSTATPIYALY